MKRQSRHHWQSRRLLHVAGAAALLGATACGSKVVVDGEGNASPTSADGGAGGGGSGPGSTGAGGAPPKPVLTPDKIDLLLAIDNSRSMADKQALLALAIPDLLNRLLNPACLDESGVPVAPGEQPSGPLEPCPPGAVREIVPILDVHIGVISSSLGGHGADACPSPTEQDCGAGTNLTNDDHGHLLARSDPLGGPPVPTYQGKGYLAWDPAKTLSPPGEDSSESLFDSLKEMVTGVGQIGCGYESQLESWYRFLVDPEPYETIEVQDGKAVPIGVDEVLLAQRKDFLRPDSLLIVMMLSDENDCSMREGGQYFFAAQILSPGGNGPFHLPRARSECAIDPSHPCCKSCGQSQEGCPPDPACDSSPTLSDLEDHVNLRCFDQKRRFGIDFLYPLDRYVNALTSPTVTNRAGEIVPNPIFSDLDPTDGVSAVRDPSLVFLTGIVGVPWQDIARSPETILPGTKTGAELSEVGPGGISGWDLIAGNPATYVPPVDPFMVESVDPRSGKNPVTGFATAPPGSGIVSPINGSERTIPDRSDLQYACIFPLLQGEERDCTETCLPSCDCASPDNDSPLCELDPKTGGRTRQVRAKAYPGLRQLAVMRDLGEQGAVASICPVQVDDPDSPDFAYRPAVNATLQAIYPRLKKP